MKQIRQTITSHQSSQTHCNNKSPFLQTQRKNAVTAARLKSNSQPRSRRGVVSRNSVEPFSPPEDWNEPHCDGRPYKVVVQAPGAGYRHVVTPADVRARLAQLPAHFLRELEVVQLARVTRKKQSFPCYGMQWGATLYLYPLEESLTETFHAPPAPAVVNEARMFGGVWSEPEPGVWMLTWTKKTIRDFYLNNILIHELGHLLDDRNDSYTDRERFAEWFAIQYGYLPTGGSAARRSPRDQRNLRRRHHCG